MAVDLPSLKVYVGESETTEYDALLTDCLAEAQALVDKYRTKKVWDTVTAAYIEELVTVPPPLLDRAYKEVAADLFHRRNAPNGIRNEQFAGLDGVSAAPVRIARDPMQAVYRILGRWVTPW